MLIGYGSLKFVIVALVALGARNLTAEPDGAATIYRASDEVRIGACCMVGLHLVLLPLAILLRRWMPVVLIGLLLPCWTIPCIDTFMSYLRVSPSGVVNVREPVFTDQSAEVRFAQVKSLRVTDEGSEDELTGESKRDLEFTMRDGQQVTVENVPEPAIKEITAHAVQLGIVVE